MKSCYYTALGHSDGFTKQYTHDLPIDDFYMDRFVITAKRRSGFAITPSSKYRVYTHKGVRTAVVVLFSHGFPPVEMLAFSNEH